MTQAALAWYRRARPLLGTLVEIAVPSHAAVGQAAAELAFLQVQKVHSCMSRFDPGSDISRFAQLGVGQSLEIDPATAHVLHAAQVLYRDSNGLFDITQGLAPEGWRCEGLILTRLSPSAAFDLGGIAKGYAVDCAVEALQHAGCAAGWVNAGGDLRVFGEVQIPVMLRDERNGGLHPFMALGDGAVATSYLGPGQRSQIYAPSGAALLAHVTVAAPQCMHADALTKVVAASGDEQHPLLKQYGAQAWLHREA